MFLLSGSCFFHPHWCFCCEVHAFFVRPDTFVARFMIFPCRLMLLLPFSCFSRPRWCFCCHVHVFSVHVAQMLSLAGSCFLPSCWCFSRPRWADPFVAKFFFCIDIGLIILLSFSLSIKDFFEGKYPTHNRASIHVFVCFGYSVLYGCGIYNSVSIYFPFFNFIYFLDVCNRVGKGFKIGELERYIMLFIFYFI